MKHILFILCFSALAFSSCVQMEDDLFTESPLARVENLNKKAKETLTSSPNGWIMNYFANKKLYGGFNLYLTFTEGTVKASSELNPTKFEESFYSYKCDDSATLSFDTFNSVIHEFSDPKNDGIGYGGDFEFSIVSVNPNEVILRGKKTSNIIVMHPLEEDFDWKSYVEKVQTLSTFLKYSLLKLNAQNSSIEFEETGTNKILSSVGTEVSQFPYIYTDKGIYFYTPIELGGLKMQNFVLSEDKTRMNCTDPEASEGYITSGDAYTYFTDKISITSVSANSSEWILKDKDKMSEKVRVLYETIENSAKEQKYSLESIGIGYFGKRKSYGMCIHVSGASLYYDTETTFNNDTHTVSFKYNGKTNGSAFYEQISGVKELLELLSTTYSISNYNIDMSNIKMVATSDSQLYFNINLKK